jgi:hypothetical protein
MVFWSFIFSSVGSGVDGVVGLRMDWDTGMISCDDGLVLCEFGSSKWMVEGGSG